MRNSQEVTHTVSRSRLPSPLCGLHAEAREAPGGGEALKERGPLARAPLWADRGAGGAAVRPD